MTTQNEHRSMQLGRLKRLTPVITPAYPIFRSTCLLYTSPSPRD